MTEPLYFMMGQFKAVVPADRLYSRRHMWLLAVGEGKFRVGFTSYSVRLLQDVYFLEWTIDEDTVVKDKQEIGEVESSKAVSALYAPSAGVVTAFNETLLNDPSGINADNYGSGWLFDMRADTELLTPEEYVRVLEVGWDETQRTIKGQMN